jgi:hypothetical protein
VGWLVGAATTVPRVKVATESRHAGYVVISRFISTFTSRRDGRSHRDAGIAPTKRFSRKTILFKVETNPNSVGIVPVRLLAPTSK